MTDTFVSVWDQSVLASEMPPKPIAAAGGNASWPAAQAEGQGVTRPFVNEEQNSRLAAELGIGPWRVRWTRPTTQGLQPAWVLTAGGRIVVQGESMWQLFDGEGVSVRVGTYAPAVIALDAARGVFYAPGEAGEIVARDLTTAEKRYYFSLTFGQSYERKFLGRTADSFFAVSVERQMDPHVPEPNASMAEVATLPEHPRIDELRSKAFAPVSAHLYHKSRVLKGAIRGRAVILATENQVTYADLELKAHRVFSGEFVPVALSVDEGGRAYMLVDAGGRRALWLITPSGERVAAIALSDAAQGSDTPPIVGYDHSIYVIGGDRIYAFGPDGAPKWESAQGPKPAGAAIAADGWLIASIGARVMAFSRTGEPSILHSIDGGEQLQTVPVLDERGDILVASRTRLFCLTRR